MSHVIFEISGNIDFTYFFYMPIQQVQVQNYVCVLRKVRIDALHVVPLRLDM